MYSKKVTRYYAKCGKGFWKKSACLDHEETCKCWTNPKNKACKTCLHGCFQGDEPDTGVRAGWECMNGENTNDGHVNDLENVDYISVNCAFWSLNETK